MRTNKKSGLGCEIDGLFSCLFLIIDLIAPRPFCPIGDFESIREKRTELISRMSAGLPPRPSLGTTSRVPPRKRAKDYSPVDWSEYWAEKNIVGKEGDDFNYYTMGEADAECYVKGPIYLTKGNAWV